MTPSREQVLELFENSGGTDLNYLGGHLSRFLDTYRRVDETWDRSRGVHLLDIGAHWLHQAMVFRLGGFEVTAMDLPLTFELPQVQALAEAHSIDLIGVDDLSKASELESLPESSIDLVIFAEILEHITFNPVRFWTAIYRVLKPGGVVVITTPNYYAAGSRCWDLKRFMKWSGGGITVDEILTVNTYGHHWKEFSMREVIWYFHLLSPDFVCRKAEYTDYGRDESTLSWIQRRFDRMKTGLHLEFELERKERGIVVEPHW